MMNWSEIFGLSVSPLAEVDKAYMEPDGAVSVIKKKRGPS